MGVIFESFWDTALGATDTAWRDGGKWTWATSWDNPPTPVMQVVTGGPNGHNALRLTQHGPNWPANVQVNDVVAAGQDFYLRFYFRNDDTSGAGDHVATVDTWEYPNLTFLRKYGGATSWQHIVSVYGCGFVYPIGHWYSGKRLANGAWYRMEYFVHYVDATHIQVHPRVYDATNTLILSDADYHQEDFGLQIWNGRNDWSLAAYYAAGLNFCVVGDVVASHAGGHAMRNIGLGNNGNAGATDTGLFWYFAAVQIRDDTWPGPLDATVPAPIPSPAPPPVIDTTPPTIVLNVLSVASTAVVAVRSTVKLIATVADNVGVVGVQWKVDGANAGPEQTAAPYALAWTFAKGAHSVIAVARDAAGNPVTSAAVTVVVP